MTQPQVNGRRRLYLIDGYALIYRAFFALISRPLQTQRGENTSAAWGITKFLLKVLEEHKPEYLGVIFDAGSSERHQIFPEYKATRQKMPDELKASLPRVRDIITALNVPILELEGYEADDVIGTMAVRAKELDLEAVIVSGDKDFYQLIRPGICLLNPGRGGPAAVDEEWVDVSNAHERLGVAPEHVADFLGLIGDSSDNVPGVRGIGPKTAIQLIEQFGSIDQIIANADQITNKRAREAILECAADARLSKELVTIRTDLPVVVNLDELECGPPDRERLKELFLELEFHSLVRDHTAPQPESKVRHAVDYRALYEPAEVLEVVSRAREAGRIAVDVEGTHLDPIRAELVGLAIAIQPHEAFYLPFRHCSPSGELLDVHDVRNLPDIGSAELRPLVELLGDPNVRKVGHNLKHDLLVLRRAGVTLRGLDFDTMIASYLLDPNRREYGLDSLALQHFDRRTTTYQELVKRGKADVPYAEVEVDRCRDYLCEDADVALQLQEVFEPEMERLQLKPLFDKVEIPLIEALAEMEWEGIAIDPDFFRTLERKLTIQLRGLEQDIYREAGIEFNIASNPQLREVLFDRLGLPVKKRTKTGPSTDVTVLEELAAEGYALPTLLMQYRQLDKLLGTYVSALPRSINPRTGRIHTTYSQTVATTGRLSSSDPNLQNIPIRTELGAEIRRGFVPAAGNIFISADYSQIELRILAHYSEDEAFLEAFRSGIDIHRQTAALVFGVEPDQVTRTMRDRAKTVNFGIIYGIGPFSLSQQLGISRDEGEAFIGRYFERFPGVRRYLDSQVELARQRGFIETLTGRRRYIPEMRAKNFNIRSFGERVATNAPIQGTAADLIKIAMIEIHRSLQEQGARTRMLLQVHDELLFESPREERDATMNLVKQKMEGAAELRVPLVVEIGTGDNWLECK